MSRAEIPVTLEFDSVYAFAQHCKVTARAKGCSNGSQSRASESWDFGLGYEGAIEMGLHGGYWPEGAQQMKDTMALTNEMVALEPLPLVERSMVGHAPCVAAYVMGHPMDMIQRKPNKQLGKPVLSLGLSMVCSSATNSQHRLNQGAAVLTMIDELEKQGYRCELVSVYRSGPNNSRPFKEWCNAEVLLKTAQDVYNPVAVAFALAHPAWLRRLGFKCIETREEWAKVTQSCYGDGLSNKQWLDSMATDFDVVIPNICGNEYSTPEKAMDQIRQLIDRELDRLAVGAGQ